MFLPPPRLCNSKTQPAVASLTASVHTTGHVCQAAGCNEQSCTLGKRQKQTANKAHHGTKDRLNGGQAQWIALRLLLDQEQPKGSPVQGRVKM